MRPILIDTAPYTLPSMIGSDRADILVIGGGFGAVAFLDSLAARRAGARVIVVEPSATAPAATAYVDAHPTALLNAPADRMSVRAGASDDFVRWLGDRGGGAAFVPRALYGRYLADRWRDAVDGLQRNGGALVHRQARATTLAPMGGALAAHLDDGGPPVEAAAAFVAIGPAWRRPFAPPHPRIATFQTLDAAGAARAFGGGVGVIIGAGLSAVDAALALIDEGWRGRLLMVSPTGGAAQGPGLVSFAKHADRIRALWSATPPAWRKRRLDRNLAWWNRLRHRLAPEAAQALRAARASGRVLARPGRVVDLAAHEAHVCVRLAQGAPIEAAFVVDARGFDFKAEAHPLFAAMLRAGVARPCPTGYGLHMDAHGRVGGDETTPIYAAGAAVFGAELEATSAAALVRHAGRAADGVLEALRARV